MPDITGALWDIRSLEQNAQKKTALHRLHPLAKLAVTVCYIVCVVSYPRYNIGGLLVFAAYPIFMMILAEAPPAQFFKRLLIVLPIVAAACAANLFLDTQTAFYLGAAPVSYGFLSFVSALMKALLTVTAALVFISCTPVIEIVAALRQVRVPEAVTTQLLLTYRYLDLLIKEASSMYTAYKLRAPGQKGIKWGDMGSFLGGLLLRTIDRGERIYNAMKLRGFSGGLHAGGAHHFYAKDAVFATVLCTLFIIARVLGVETMVGGMFA